eukprot:g5817.t1
MKTLVSWSSGKDSAWVLHLLRKRTDVKIAGLFTTVNEEFQRVAMHAVRLALLQSQAAAVGLPLKIIYIPFPCTNEDYERQMGKFIEEIKAEEVEAVAFGDLFLRDVRQYREDKMKGTGIQTLFPNWGLDTTELAREMVKSGVKARITCVNPKQLDGSFAGREFDESFLDDLPKEVDPCGENGEFHTFVFDGPQFRHPLSIKLGEIVERDGFVFADLIES